jgi:triacylglycerol lipase
MNTIILVHGIAATDKLRTEWFWGRIPETLRRAGFRVVFGGADAVGTIPSNAAQLYDTITTVGRETGSKVILMAHSKGGVDARWCLSRLDGGRHIAALVTLCSPHRGSELADAIVERLPSTWAATRALSRAIGRLYPDRRPQPLEAVLGLTTADMAVFNAETPDVPGVFFQSYYTTLHGVFDELALAPSYRLLRKRAGANDGFVAARSAQWGEAPKLIEGIRGGISHLEILDLKQRKVSGISIPDVWVELARNAASTL